MQKDAKFYVAGHRGMAGSAIVRRLQADGYTPRRLAHGHLSATLAESMDSM